MNKQAIKTFAVWARQKFISEITYKAGLLGVTERGAAEPLPGSAKDLQLFDVGTKEPVEVRGKTVQQRQSLIDTIAEKAGEIGWQAAFQNVVEEVAYTWFNRLIAIRFMEVNDYLPSRIRVLSSERPGKAEPDLVTSPFEAEMEFTEAEKGQILAMQEKSQSEELFRMLFIKQCNALHQILPELFEPIHDYTEPLLALSFTDQDGVVRRLIHNIPEEDFNVGQAGQVEIIGWLYQYYNTEPKEQVFTNLKRNVKITKENVPAATQLFTPHWIVRYMVENSLGRLYANSRLSADGGQRSEKERIALERELAGKMGWSYYVPEAEQTPEVRRELENQAAGHFSPADLKLIDPCMGSGHILVYAFDLLMGIYEAQGYAPRDAAQLIVEKNLYGLDVDKRAYQLAYFAVMMKARQYDRRFLTREIRPNLAYPGLDRELQAFGSLLMVDDGEALPEESDQMHFMDVSTKYRRILAGKYDVVCTNPPYMATSNLVSQISEPIKKDFPDEKADLFACFIERCKKITKDYGFQAMITQHAWMFLSSYEKAREKLRSIDTVSLLHLGARAFEEIGGEVVQTSSFVFRRSHVAGYKGTYFRLIEPTTQQGKEEMFLAGENRYTAQQDNFSKIPGARIGYWLSDTLQKQFEKFPVSKYADTRRGLQTGDSNKFIRKWFEVSICNEYLCNSKKARQSLLKWFPFNSGGAFRRWYGNVIDVVNWENNGWAIKQTGKAIIPSEERYFDEIISWNKITSSQMSARYQPVGIIPGDASPFLHSIKQDQKIILYIMAIFNSKVAAAIIEVLSPTLNFEVGNIAEIPVAIDKKTQEDVLPLVYENIVLSKTDWNSYETSWDFKRHPII